MNKTCYAFQYNMEGFERTGQFRPPIDGEFWLNGSGHVYTGPVGGISGRGIVRRIGEPSQVMVEAPQYTYEYDT